MATVSIDEAQLELIEKALNQADHLVTLNVRGESGSKFALELARTLNDLKRKFPNRTAR